METIVVMLDEMTAMDRKRIQLFLSGARNVWFIAFLTPFSSALTDGKAHDFNASGKADRGYL